eukprot:GHVQ01032166.1.p1 GENE.GHVQ01032166.1~~GHVQ01032166.1.p1  ORF type:complete len:139 (-),score=1.82 GHVQ01032166.1:131-547(-)
MPLNPMWTGAGTFHVLSSQGKQLFVLWPSTPWNMVNLKCITWTQRNCIGTGAETCKQDVSGAIDRQTYLPHHEENRSRPTHCNAGAAISGFPVRSMLKTVYTQGQSHADSAEMNHAYAMMQALSPPETHDRRDETSAR